jgi:hypothetical protein
MGNLEICSKHFSKRRADWNKIAVYQDAECCFTSMLPLLLHNERVTCVVAVVVHLAETTYRFAFKLVKITDFPGCSKCEISEKLEYINFTSQLALWLPAKLAVR